jgi:hypothetical protein
MKKWFKIFVVVLLVMGLTACKAKKEDTDENKDKNPPAAVEDPKIDEKLEDKTETKQGDLEFSDIKITSKGAINIVSAKVKNGSNKSRSFLAILYMKNADGRTLGKVEKEILNLASGATTDISIEIMGDYSNLASFEVKVEEVK